MQLSEAVCWYKHSHTSKVIHNIRCRNILHITKAVCGERYRNILHTCKVVSDDWYWDIPHTYKAISHDRYRDILHTYKAIPHNRYRDTPHTNIVISDKWLLSGMGIQKSDADRSVLSETISSETYAGEPVSKHSDSEYEYADAIGCCLAEHDIVGACLWEHTGF